jgi:hypothetical protein
MTMPPRCPSAPFPITLVWFLGIYGGWTSGILKMVGWKSERVSALFVFGLFTLGGSSAETCKSRMPS